MTVLFHDALDEVKAFLDANPDLAARRLIVRDLRGRIRILLADRCGNKISKGLYDTTRQRVQELAGDLHQRLGAYSPGNPNVLIDARVLSDFELVWNGPDTVELNEASRLLERTLFGEDWLRAPLENVDPQPPRAVMYGLKGGVGRSTAVAVLARHLATKAKRALVVDLDLEAPGVGSTLLSPEATPDFGIIDWLVEDGVGQGDRLVADIYGRSPLPAGTPGEVLVVPASGSRTGPYLPKLSRAYQGMDGEGFGARIARFIDDLEKAVDPDVVLLDCRSGLHEVAAVSLTRLGATSFLFGMNTQQTWDGYRLLFEHWRNHVLTHRKVIEAVRERMFMVAGQVPETNQKEYLLSFREAAHGLFTTTLYDEPIAPDDVDAFSFDLGEEAAPHDPIPIYWNRVFQDFDPVRNPDAVTEQQIEGFFGAFNSRVMGLLLGDEG